MEIKDFQDTEKLRFSRVCNAEFRFAQFRGTMEKAGESPGGSIYFILQILRNPLSTYQSH